MTSKIDGIISYYNTRESKWGYKLFLGGTKHFGYYPKGKENISMHQAMINMMDKVGKNLNLPKGSKVLDAGCGEGTTALWVADKYGLNVEGVDLLDFNIKAANESLNKANPSSIINFNVGNYMHIDYPDNTFDGIYTLETLVHAPNYNVALKEFRRVLKKNGKLVLFEYSMPRQDEMKKKERRMFNLINEYSAMYSFSSFTHGAFPKILTSIGFNDIKVQDITPRMIPMVKRFRQFAIIPYQFIKLFNKEEKFVNATAAITLWSYRSDFRYNIVTAVNKKLI